MDLNNTGEDRRSGLEGVMWRFRARAFAQVAQHTRGWGHTRQKAATGFEAVKFIHVGIG